MRDSKKRNPSEGVLNQTINENNNNNMIKNTYTEAKSNNKKLFLFKCNKNRRDLAHCDICGQLLKIGSITLKTFDGKMQGHYNEIINFISGKL